MASTQKPYIYSGSSQYGTYRILDTVHYGRPARLLYGADNSLQSGAALDDDPELLFDYNQRFLEILMSLQPRTAFFVGGGACTLPAAAHRLFPALANDIVEIDGLLFDLAHTYFDLPQSPQLHLIVGDASQYLAKTDKRYDVIIIDAFLGYTVPPHLLQLSTILQYRDHLTKDGVVAINFISEYKKGTSSLAHEVIAAFSEVFSHTTVYQSDPDYNHGEDQNLILTASGNDMHFDYLQSRAVGPA